MEHRIPDLLRTRKARDGATVVVILLLAGVSFCLGRLSVGSVVNATAVYAPPAASMLVTRADVRGEAVPGSLTGGAYVGSKNGTAYHLPWCSGAARIKDENKVWFASKAEAEAKGYRPAANCKGI